MTPPPLATLIDGDSNLYPMRIPVAHLRVATSVYVGHCSPGKALQLGNLQRRLDQTPTASQPRRRELRIDALPRRGASAD